MPEASYHLIVFHPDWDQLVHLDLETREAVSEEIAELFQNFGREIMLNADIKIIHGHRADLDINLDTLVVSLDGMAFLTGVE